MNQFESKKLRWKLTIGLELLTSILAVLFVISAGGYDFNQSIGLIISSTISLTTSFVVPSVRFVILGRLLKNLEDKNWFILNSKEKSEIKTKILNFPLYNSWFYMIQWSYGIFAAWRIMHLFFVPKTIVSISETTEFLSSVVTQIDELSVRLNEQADKLKSEMNFFET